MKKIKLILLLSIIINFLSCSLFESADCRIIYISNAYNSYGSVEDNNFYKIGDTAYVKGGGDLYKSGYDFVGWSKYNEWDLFDRPDNADEIYGQGYPIQIEDEVTYLYAVWMWNPFF